MAGSGIRVCNLVRAVGWGRKVRDACKGDRVEWNCAFRLAQGRLGYPMPQIGPTAPTRPTPAQGYPPAWWWP